jgi:hypothetical protein
MPEFEYLVQQECKRNPQLHFVFVRLEGATMSEETLTLRQMVLAVLKQAGEQMSYRDLSTAVWGMFPSHHAHIMNHYGHDEAKARREHRIRLGMLVKQSPAMFTATMSDGIVLVGLAATETETAVEEDEEEIADTSGIRPAVYWYTFPAYMRSDGPFPIKIGRGNSPESRVSQQVTSMPEKPEILGTFAHEDVGTLERALHAVLTLRGKRKKDAPGMEWFLTTPQEISQLIKVVLD